MIKAIWKKLECVKYPGLNRNIVELKLVESVKEEKERLEIVLNIKNEEAFPLIEADIKDVFKEYYRYIDVKLKPKEEKSINQASATKHNRAPYAKNILAVTSGKGGVGKSTVAVNVSVALAQKGYSTGLLDADVYGPNIPRMTQTGHEKLRWGANNKIIPSENFGIKIMSVGLTTPRPDTPIVWRSSVAVSALIQFLEDVDWGNLDFLVIDMPPGTGDIQLAIVQELPITAGIFVTTPQMISIDDVSRAIMMFKDIGVKIGGLVENMSFFIAPDTGKRYDIFGSGAGETLARKYGIPFLGKIPLDMKIREFSDHGTPAVVIGNSIQKGYYKNIVENLLKELE